jgi:hypothetical protein
VRVGSTEPVVASLRSTRDGDHAYAAAVTPLTGPAAAPLVRGARAGVQLTAGSAGARVQATAYDAQGRRTGGRTISIPPTATVTWSTTAAAGYVVVTPLGARGEGQAGGSGGGSGGVSGGVRGAVSYAGDGLAAVPLVSVPFRETRPHVEPGLR